MTARVVCVECRAIQFASESKSRITCRHCSCTLEVRSTEPHPDPDRDPAFRLARYSIPAQSMKLIGAYEVHDEHGSPVLFVDRPASLHPGCGSMLVQTLIFFMLMGVCVAVAALFLTSRNTLVMGITILVLGLFLSVWLSGVIVRAILPSKRIRVYADPDRRHLFFDAVVHNPRELHCMDAKGRLIAKFHNDKKFWSMKSWSCRDDDGELLFRASEDSATLGTSRRALGFAINIFGNIYVQIAQYVFGTNLSLLPTNFRLVAPDGKTTLATISRGLVAMKPYMLDLSEDEDRVLDRCLALAVALALEIGERSGKG
jgi:hypothetical protein